MGELAASLGIEVVAVGGAPYGGTAVDGQDEALALVERLADRQRGAAEGQPLGRPRPPGRPAARRGGRPVKVLLFFGGPSEERDVSAGSIKPWVTYLQADPTAELTVVFVDRELRAYRMPPVYYYANTCADFESQLSALDLELDWDEVADLARDHDVAVPLIHGEFGEDGALQERLEAWGVPYVFSAARRPRAARSTRTACYATLAAAGLPGAGPPLGDPPGAWSADRAGVAGRLAALTPILGSEGGAGRSPGGRQAADGWIVVRGRRGAGRAAGSWPTRSMPPSPPPPVPCWSRSSWPGTEFSVVVLDGPGRCPDGPGPHRGREAAGQPGLRHRGEVPARLRASSTTPRCGWTPTSLHGIRRQAAEAFGALGLRHMARIDGFRTDGRHRRRSPM